MLGSDALRQQMGAQGRQFVIRHYRPEVVLRHYTTPVSYTHLAAQMGRNGRAYVLSRYQWPTIIPRYRDLFARVLTEKAATDDTDFTDLKN